MHATGIFALGLGLLMLFSTPAAAGGWGGRYGGQWQASEQTSSSWSYRRTEETPACPDACAPAGGIALPGTFFEGDGGVGGFEEADFGGGGGGFVFAGSGAHAFASASARVSVHVSASAHVHGGGHGHGCGCK